MKNKKVIIIGAGVAGLATAARLASLGFQVQVYEKNESPGGKLTSMNQNGFHFDLGPSLFTAPYLLKEVFDFAKEPFEEYFEYQELPIAFKYFYEDGTVLNAYTNTEKFADELSEKLNESKDSVFNYLQNANKLYDNIGNFFIGNSLHKIGTYLKKDVFEALIVFKAKYVFKSLHQYNDSKFNHSKTVQLFNRFATYNGSSPYKAPAMLSMIPHLEHNDGTYYPKGGMISITNALYKLCVNKCVLFHFNKGVDRIIANNNKVKGVVVSGENIYADYVVSNCDVFFTYKKLLQNQALAAKVLKQERSSSAVIFYWGIKKEFQELELHNILFTNDYKAEFESIFSHKKNYNDPTVYINITSKCEPGLQAPPQKENWFVMVNAPSNTNINWDEQIIEIKKNIINKINNVLKTNIEELIELEEVLHPSLIESRTSSYLGSLYGTSSNSRFAAFLRHSNFSKQYNGLYFVGGSVHPGGGIPLCLQSAKITSNILAKSN
ncbi:MAG: 1-hydroxycarotenoid 3,4-desaturase CrtD [Chitinophagaceae bacterium]